MPLKIQTGFYLLAQKTLAVTTAALASITGFSQTATSLVFSDRDTGDKITNSNQQKKLTHKLVLKLGENGANRLVAAHTSHSSHSSHSSHASHYSSSSSSSRSSTSTPTYTPAPVIPSAPLKSTLPSNSSKSIDTATVTKSKILSTPSSSNGTTNEGTAKRQLDVSQDSLKVRDVRVFFRTLKKGMTGEDVKMVNEKLKLWDFDVAIDDRFSDMTEKAVKTLQRIYKLKPDGIIDQETWNIIIK
jgi:murein L,D-transpeptidase YcbB/YkuD